MNKYKIFSLVSVFCLLFLFLLSCGSTNENGAPAGMKELSNDITDYKVYVPEDWTVDMSTGVVSAYAYDKSNISVMELAAGEGIFDIDSYFAVYEKQLKDVLGDYTEESAPTKTELSGFEAKNYRYSGTIGGEKYQYRQVISLVNRSFAGVTNDYRVYVITYTAKDSQFEEHSEDVNKIIESFSFKD